MKNSLFLSLSLLISLYTTSALSMEAPTTSLPSTDVSAPASPRDENSKPIIEEMESKEKNYNPQPETKNNHEVRTASRFPALEVQTPSELLRSLLEVKLDPFAGFRTTIKTVDTTLHAALASYLNFSHTEPSTTSAGLFTGVEAAQFLLEKGKFINAGDALYEFLENPNRAADLANTFINHPATDRIKEILADAFRRASKHETTLNYPEVKLSDAIGTLNRSLRTIKVKEELSREPDLAILNHLKSVPFPH